MLGVVTHPWWPHLFTWPRAFDPISWWWLSLKGYALTSSWFQVTFITAALVAYRHKNCEHKGCPWLGHAHPEHGRPVCRSHYHHDVVPARPQNG